jgi:hypothetical protein
MDHGILVAGRQQSGIRHSGATGQIPSFLFGHPEVNRTLADLNEAAGAADAFACGEASRS